MAEVSKSNFNFVFDFNRLDIEHWDDQPKYGTFYINQSNEERNACDLLWAYRQAFEAMAAVEYQHKDSVFRSPLIHQLRRLHRQNQRIEMSDFAHIPAKCIVSMLKHYWIFEDWSTNEIWEAVLMSIKPKRKMCHKSGHKKRNFTEFDILLHVIHHLSKTGHALYPFCGVPFSEDIAKQLAHNQVVIYTKHAGITSRDLCKSYTKFLQIMRIDMESSKLSAAQQQDMEIIAQLLDLTYTEQQRVAVLRALWENAATYKHAMLTHLRASDIDRQANWEKSLTSIIADYM